jgi:phosphate/sulfate permease
MENHVVFVVGVEISRGLQTEASPHTADCVMVAQRKMETSAWRKVARLVLPAALFLATIATVMSENHWAKNSKEVGVPYLYKGLITWAFFWAFLDAYTIGANDVGNAFANAVGAGTLTHRGACLIACIFEFVGVVALGSNVTDTIKSKMTNVDYFKYDPYVLATGMSMVNVGGGGWVLAATLLSMPVSTTHAVVGAVLGMGIAAFGTQAVIWDFDKGGFLQVVSAWFISPCLSGVLAAIFYLVTKYTVLMAPDDDTAFRRGLILMPLFCFFVFGTIWGFLFMKGIPALKDWDYNVSAPLTVGLGVIHGLMGYIFVVPWLRRTIKDKENIPWWGMGLMPCLPIGKFGYYDTDVKDQEKGVMADSVPFSSAPMQQQPMIGQQMMPMQQYGQPAFGQPAFGQPYPGPYGGMPGYPGMPVMGSAFGGAETGEYVKTERLPGAPEPPPAFLNPLTDKQHLFALREQDAAMHAAAFNASPDTEQMFKFLQLSSCCLFSLSHGANDVANAIGPFSAVWLIYSTGKVDKKAEVPIWILVYGGVALDIGLLTMGHQIMSALGNRLTLQTPSRGYCIELAAMFTVMIASRLGIPVSTTHSICGATVAVGLCNGTTEAVNCRLIFVILFGWGLTCPMAGIVTGLLFWGICSAPRPDPGNGYWSGMPPPIKPPTPAPK